MTQLTVEDIKKNLSNREWRLNNLYWIKGKEGVHIPFRLNWAQKYLLDNIWYLNVILKGRQLGVTTFFCILYLDDVLFNGLDAGLIAHTREAAEKIFDTKIRYAWDYLPEAIKSKYQVNSETARELRFKMGDIESSIYVGTSLRSGTVQRLHISELGTTDQKYPSKSEEIKTGALNTVHAGQVITIESTAKGEVGVFADICKGAIDIQKQQKKLSPMEWKFHFLPWFRNPEYRLGSKVAIDSGLKDYFDKVEAETGYMLSQEQKNWYCLKRRTQGDAMKSEFPSTPEEAFEASLEGAYYGKEMTRAMQEDRITSVPWIPELPVDTWWDLGISTKKTDAMSIIFTQDVGLEVHIIDFYGNSGEGFVHYAKVLKEKPYAYGRHWGPHDLQVKELGTGKTRIEMARRLGVGFTTAPKLSFSDGVDAARMVLPKCWFDEENATELVRALKYYRKEWDDRLGKFKDNPLEDWTCVTGDTAIRTLRGWKPIKDVSIEDYVWGYSIKEHRLIPTRIERVGKTRRNAELVEVLLDNGNKIKCTPEHLFMKRNEEYVRAIDLNVGDSLMPFYENKKQKHKDYNQIYLNDGTYAEEHRFVYSRFNALLRDFDKGFIIHHLDEDNKNNTPENLTQWTKKQHMDFHMSKPEWIKKREEFWKIAKAKQLERIKHKCSECGQEFWAIGTAKYCCKACKDRFCSRMRRRKLEIKPRNFKTKNHKVIGINILKKREDVYDLYAPETSNFVAEGVIIHNCDPADAFRLMAVGHKDHRSLGFYDEEEREMSMIRQYEASRGQEYDPLNPFFE